VKKLLPLVLLLPLVGGCISHEVRVEPITLQPIHMTLDVNLHVDHAAPVTSGGSDAASPEPSAVDAPPAS
jgi:hypothetical protein